MKRTIDAEYLKRGDLSRAARVRITNKEDLIQEATAETTLDTSESASESESDEDDFIDESKKMPKPMNPHEYGDVVFDDESLDEEEESSSESSEEED